MWITSGFLHISTALNYGWVSMPDAGHPELWGIAVRRQSQCREISTCPVPTEVLSAQIVEAWMMFPRGDMAAVVGSVSGPTISWSLHSHAHISSPSFESWVRLTPTATLATVIYWMSASFAPIHPGWLSQAKGGVWPPKPYVTAEGQQWQNNLWQAFGSFIYNTKQSPAVSPPGSLQVEVEKLSNGFSSH